MRWARRANEQVHDSRGDAREGAVGSRSRRQFKRLPCVGAKTARTWWRLGLRRGASGLDTLWRLVGIVSGAASEGPWKQVVAEGFSLTMSTHELSGCACGVAQPGVQLDHCHGAGGSCLCAGPALRILRLAQV